MGNTLQTIATVRTVLIAIGGIAIGFGLATKEQIAALTDPSLWTAIGGAVVAIGGIVTAVRARSTKNMITATANLDGVSAVIAPSLAAGSPAPNVVATSSEAARVGA